MRLRVLGCSGAELPGHNPSAFLLDDGILLDAGTVGAVLTTDEQARIRRVLVTHAHLDHIRGIAFLVDNLLVAGIETTIEVIGIAETLQSIRDHVLNGVIWPDFSRLPSPERPAIRYRPIEPGTSELIDGYNVTAIPVNHVVPAVAYRVEREGAALVYAGDTGPTERLWREAGHLAALIVEISFPNSMDELAIMTGHLTPALLAMELAKMPVRPLRILVTHLKPQYKDSILAEIAALKITGLEVLRDGMDFLLANGKG